MTDAQSRLAESEAELEQFHAASDGASGAARPSPSNTSAEPPDFFVTRDGMTFAGSHLIVDLWDACPAALSAPEGVERALVHAAKSAGATVLSTSFHHFQPNGGVSGVVVLAESHISIHTWPERQFAAVDVFMCGACRPMDTVAVLKAAFQPGRLAVNEIRRGVVG